MGHGARKQLAELLGDAQRRGDFSTRIEMSARALRIEVDGVGELPLPLPFVVDTSRNGNGSNGQWCKPSGRHIGTPTRLGGGAEMLLWMKTPGESDGNRGVGAGSSAGQLLPEVAYKMIYRY